MKRLLCIIAGIVIAGCALPNPKAAFTTIEDSTAIVVADLNGIISKLSQSKPDVPGALALAKDAQGNATKIPDSATEAQKDYNLLKADDDKVRSSIGYRVEEFLIGSFWAAVATGIVALIVCIIFPAITPALMNIGGFFGGLVQHISAALPLQNLKLVVASLQGKKIAAVPKTQPVSSGAVTVTKVTPA